MVDHLYPGAERITLVPDNLSTHKPESFYEVFPPETARRLVEKLELHYTPVHGSWLNIAEIAISLLGLDCLARRIGDFEQLKKEIAAWEKSSNKAAKSIDWRLTTNDARIKLKRLYPTIVPITRSVARH